MNKKVKYTNIADLKLWLQGKHLLPAGAVPLAMRDEHTLVCLTPSGDWISWIPNTPALDMTPSTQRNVMDLMVENLGGTAAKMAEALGISRRTVESWRGEYAQLPIGKAFQIAKILAEKQSKEG